MDKKDKKKSYSDLEVVIASSPLTSSETPPPLPRQSYWNEKFVATPDSPPPPPALNTAVKNEKAAPYGIDFSPADQIPPAPPAYFLVDSKGQTQALYTVPSDTSDAASVRSFKGGYNAAVPPPSQGGWWRSLGDGRRVCGLRKNIFLASMAGVCFLIFGLLTTVLLLTLHPGHKGHGGGDDGPQFSKLNLLQKKDNGPVLSATDLAAMNWTDMSTGTQYTGVVYQSSVKTGSALMFAIKNENSQSWTRVNISASVPEATLDILPGSPLAAATNNGLWNIYYVNSSLGIAEVYSTNPDDANSWQKGDFAKAAGHPSVVLGSQLSAMWQRCAKCDNALFVMWQNGAGSIMTVNMTNLTWGQPVTVAAGAALGSGLAISAFTDTGSRVTTGADANAIRMYYETNDGLMEMLKGPIGGGNLVAGNFGKPIVKGLPMMPMPKIASLTYAPTSTSGWTSNLITYIDPCNGELTSANWQPSSDWKVNQPQYNGGPDDLVKDGFSSAANTQAMKVYVFSPKEGEIHEYATNSTNVFAWEWKDKVDL